VQFNEEYNNLFAAHSVCRLG